MQNFTKINSYIKAIHLFFDFSLNQWNEFIDSNMERDPFKNSIFAKWQNVLMPRSLGEALDLSERFDSCKRISIFDKNYPECLKAIPAPPPVIYILGNNILPYTSQISIVGTRKPSAFGFNNTCDFAEEIAKRKLGIISGLALGIDSIAHLEALRNESYTMAILGSGVDQIYPKSNFTLAKKILEKNGTILSPFPPGVAPMPYHFPRRNWLIAAMSSGTIVIEGSEKSGAMITGKAAIELGKPVVALTQDFRTPGGRGAIELIRSGACAVANAQEAIEVISMPLGGQMDLL